jgi:hypothetical protein
MTKNKIEGLKVVTPKPVKDLHANILLYGEPKTGKSTGAASAPGPILYLNADAPNALVFARRTHGNDKITEVKVEGHATLLAAGRAIEKGEFETVVIDTVGETYREVLDAASSRALRPQVQFYGDTGTHIERFCRWLCEQPVNVVFVCHEQKTPDEETGVIERMPYTGTKSSVLAAKLLAMVDVIGYTGRVEGEGDEPDRYMATLVPAPGRRGGDRFGVLGRARDLNLSEWVGLARESAAQQPQKEGK